MAATSTPALTLTERINRIEVSATMAVVAEADKLRQGGADLVDFGAGEPHFQTPRHIKDAAIAAIEGNFSKYTPVGGTAELRDAIIKRHAADFGTSYKREEVIASTGGKHAIFNAISVLVDHGDEVILPVPYWVSFKDIVRYAGGTPVFVETDESQNFKLTAQMVERAITPRTKLIVLNSPNNPSGAVMSREDVTSIIRLAHERGIYVMSDECYVYLDYTGHRFSAGEVQDAKEHLVIVGSLSKTYAMTGWREGFALGPGTDRVGDAEAAEPVHLESHLHRAEGGRGGIDRIAGLRRRNAPGLHPSARPDRDRLARDSGHHLHPAAGRVLRLSECFGLYRQRRDQVGRRSCQPAAARSARGRRSGRGLRHQEHIRCSYATSQKEIDRGLERMKKFFGSIA